MWAYKRGIHLAEEVNENTSPELMVEAVHTKTKEFIRKNKFVTLIGGEHSISIGSIRAFTESCTNLTVLLASANQKL